MSSLLESTIFISRYLLFVICYVSWFGDILKRLQKERNEKTNAVFQVGLMLLLLTFMFWK